MMSLNGTAIVVGGGGGIGRACAVRLAKDHVAAIVVADLDQDAAAETLQQCRVAATSGSFHGEAVQLDVCHEESISNLFLHVSETFGRIEYCINCAGMGSQQTTDIVSLSGAEFQKFMEVNATGMFLVTREASIAMRKQELVPVLQTEPKRGATRGAIVNLGSASSLVATGGVLPYTASKHAALGLTKNSALDNAPYAIRVNCVCPSWVETPMVQRAIEGVEGLGDFIQKAVPMGRIATPEEIADAVAFLCSPRASYITGSSLVVDGGTTLTAIR